MAENDHEPAARDVTVLGCGLMGFAVARTLAAIGLKVGVWNRTPERARALADDRITALASVEDAVAASPLVMACLSSYGATTAALDPVRTWQGTTLVNLASGAPQEATALASWAAERGAEYLDGSIVCFPRDIGTDRGAILYGGSPTAWSEHERTLMTLGASSAYLSERVTDPCVLDVGIVGAFYVSALSAYVDAATYVLGQGVAPEVLDLLTRVTVDGLKTATRDAADAIARGEHDSDQATIDTYAEGAGTALAVMQGAGHRARVLAAAVDGLRAASRRGLGSLGFSAQATTAPDDPIGAVR